MKMNIYTKIFGLFDIQTKIRFEQVKFHEKYSGFVGSGSDEQVITFFVPSEVRPGDIISLLRRVDLFFAKVVATAHQEQKQFFSGKSFFISNLIDFREAIRSLFDYSRVL